MASRKKNLKNFWLNPSPRTLWQFVTEAKGEDYDMISFDSGYDYDPENLNATKFVANVLMYKYKHLDTGSKMINRHIYLEDMPTDGTVVLLDEPTDNRAIKKSRLFRNIREQNADIIYIPKENPRYKEILLYAIDGYYGSRPRNYWNMTEKEIRYVNFYDKTEWLRENLFYLFLLCAAIIGFVRFIYLMIINN